MGAYILVSVLILITAALLMLVVLVQNSKGGGLASNFAGSNQYMGVRKTADFLEKATWTLAVVLLVLSLVSIFAIPRSNSEGIPTSKTSEEIHSSYNPNELPASEAPVSSQPATEEGNDQE
jgi:preprotein translocase subunit SecG